MPTLLDDITPARLHAAGRQDYDALVAWMVDHGIVLDDTFRTLVHQDDDALTATVSEYLRDEYGHRYLACREEHEHTDACSEVASLTRTIPVTSPPPIVWAIDPTTCQLLGPPRKFTADEYFGEDEPPWRWPACPHCGAEVDVTPVYITRAEDAEPKLAAGEWECNAEHCLMVYLHNRIAEEEARTSDPRQKAQLAVRRQLVTEVAEKIEAMDRTIYNEWGSGGEINRQEFLRILAQPYARRPGFQQRWRT